MEKIKRKKLSVRQMAYMSMLLALSIVVKGVKLGKINFGGLPIIFSGYALGPGYGFFVGAMVDLLGVLLGGSRGMPNPVFTISSGLTALIPVMVSELLRDEYPNYKLWKILIGVVVGQIITSVLIVPFFMNLLYTPGTLYIRMGKAFVRQMTQAPVYALIIKYLLDRTTRLINYRDLK